MLALGGFTLSGSSPLARGSPHGPPHRQPGRGIIPARAGFTLVSACRSGVSGDHPRSRGVHGGGWGDGVAGLGSSPLARGSLLHREVGRSVDRIIPARAGFTRQLRPGGPLGSDHPRSRGVHDIVPSGLTRSHGSSPLARGSLLAADASTLRIGIIPARAGFTRRRRSPPADGRDHPRSRGVHDVVRVNPWTIIRIIPARAGFTPGRSLPPRPLRDHPRSRGVHGAQISWVVPVAGSSPLARGSHSRILGIPTTSHPIRPRLHSLPT